MRLAFRNTLLMLAACAAGCTQNTPFDTARAYYRAEQYESARDLLEAFLSSSPTPTQRAEAGYVLGWIYEMDLRWPEAERAWSKAAAVQASHPAADAARLRLVWLDELAKTKEQQRKIFLLRRLVEQARAALDAGRPRAVVRLAQHAREITPDHWAPHFLIASALAQADDTAGASAAAILARDRGDAVVQAQVNQFLAHLEELQANQEHFRDALDKRDMHHTAEAAAEFEKVYRSDPSRLDAGMAAALEYADAGLNAKAVEVLKQLEKSGPTEVRLEAARLRARLEDAGDLSQAKNWIAPPAATQLKDPQLERERADLDKAQWDADKEMELALAAAKKRREQQGQLAAELKRLNSEFEAAKMEMDTYTGRSSNLLASSPYFQTPSSVAAAAANSVFASARMPLLQVRMEALEHRIELLRGQLDLEDEVGAAANRDFVALREAERKREQENVERAAFVNGLLGVVQKGMADFQAQSQAFRQQSSPNGPQPPTSNSGNGQTPGRVAASEGPTAPNSAECTACASDPQYKRLFATAASSGGQLAVHQATVYLYQCMLRSGGCGKSPASIQKAIDAENQTIRSLMSGSPVILPH